MRDQYHQPGARVYDRRWREYTQHALAPILDLAAPLLHPGLRVFDAGCGTGTLLDALITRQPTIAAVGADASPAMIAQARAKLGDRAQFLVLNLNNPLSADLAAQRFDLIACASVLHYLRDPAAVVQRLAALLAPGGALIVADFTRHGWWWPGMETLLRVADRQHHRTLSAPQIARLVADAGLTITATEQVDAGWPWRVAIVAGKQT